MRYRFSGLGMRKAKPIYLIFVRLLPLGIAGYFAMDQDPGGLAHCYTNSCCFRGRNAYP